MSSAWYFVQRLRELLTSMGDRFTDEEVTLQAYFKLCTQLYLNVCILIIFQVMGKEILLQSIFCQWAHPNICRLMKCSVVLQLTVMENLIIVSIHESLSMVLRKRLDMCKKNLTSLFFFFFFLSSCTALLKWMMVTFVHECSRLFVLF